MKLLIDYSFFTVQACAFSSELGSKNARNARDPTPLSRKTAAGSAYALGYSNTHLAGAP